MRAPWVLAVTTLVAACSDGTSDPPPTPSVAVTTVAPRQGGATRWLTGYGSATPASNGQQTLSVAQPGQVVGLAVTPGATVRAGQRLVTFAVAPSALSGYEAAATALTTAREQRDTAARLLTQQLATRDQLAQADKALADAQVALAAQRREGAGQAVQTLNAPFDGVVTAIPVAPGDRTQPGAALVTVARKAGIVVTVGIDPAARAQIHSGAAARLVRIGGGAMVAGHVLRIDGQLNPATRLVDVDLGFPTGALLPGEALQADIAVGQSDGWLVPHDAVVTGDATATVFQVAAGKAKAVPVAIVQSDGKSDVVTGAIDPHRPLIVAGAYQIEDGGAVRAAR